MNLEFFVANRKLTAKGHAALTADTAQCDTFTIDFDREWDGLVKVVTLENGDNTVQVLYTGKTPLPRQVCGRGDLRLLCCGYRSKGDSVAVVRTFPMIRPVRMVGAAAAVADTAQPEAASLYEQLMAAAARAEAAAQAMTRASEGGQRRALRAACLIFHSMEPIKLRTPRIPV